MPASVSCFHNQNEVKKNDQYSLTYSKIVWNFEDFSKSYHLLPKNILLPPTSKLILHTRKKQIYFKTFKESLNISVQL
jgi:hypothetical protein